MVGHPPLFLARRKPATQASIVAAGTIDGGARFGDAFGASDGAIALLEASCDGSRSFVGAIASRGVWRAPTPLYDEITARADAFERRDHVWRASSL